MMHLKIKLLQQMIHRFVFFTFCIFFLLFSVQFSSLNLLSNLFVIITSIVIILSVKQMLKKQQTNAYMVE